MHQIIKLWILHTKTTIQVPYFPDWRGVFTAMNSSRGFCAPTGICFLATSLHWFRLWLVAWMAPSHYLNQCWNIINWPLRNKLQWNFNQNSNIFIQENALENVVYQMAFTLSRPQCVIGSISQPNSLYILIISLVSTDMVTQEYSWFLTHSIHTLIITNIIFIPMMISG